MYLVYISVERSGDIRMSSYKFVIRHVPHRFTSAEVGALGLLKRNPIDNGAFKSFLKTCVRIHQHRKQWRLCWLWTYSASLVSESISVCHDSVPSLFNTAEAGPVVCLVKNIDGSIWWLLLFCRPVWETAHSHSILCKDSSFCNCWQSWLSHACQNAKQPQGMETTHSQHEFQCRGWRVQNSQAAEGFYLVSQRQCLLESHGRQAKMIAGI